MVLKLVVVATSTVMRDGRSARAHTMPESSDTSPDWTPWVMTGRSAARLRYGRAMSSSPVAMAAEPAVASSRRRLHIRIVMATPRVLRASLALRPIRGRHRQGRFAAAVVEANWPSVDGLSKKSVGPFIGAAGTGSAPED